MSIFLKVEAGPGDTIGDTCIDMCKLAKRLDIWVEARFNGIDVIVGPHSSAIDAIQAYHREAKKS